MVRHIRTNGVHAANVEEKNVVNASASVKSFPKICLNCFEFLMNGVQWGAYLKNKKQHTRSLM